MEPSSKRMRLKRDAPSWSRHDVHTLLDLISAKYDIRVINSPRQRNKSLFLSLQEDFRHLGKPQDWLQIREKWKYLKRCYRKYVKELETGEVVKDWEYYYKLHALLTGGELKNAAELVVDYTRDDCDGADDDSDTSREETGDATIRSNEDSNSGAVESEADEGVAENGIATDITEMDRLVRVIQEEGEKNRKASILAAELLVRAMNENVNKLVTAIDMRRNQTKAE